LHCNSLTIAHVLIPRSNVGEGLHWLYVPETDAPFYRVSFPHNVCNANCPADWSALTVEIGGEIPDLLAAEVEILRGLRSIGLVGHQERDVELIWDTLKYGYVVSDLQWEKRRADALSFLKEHGILSLGRYGRWEYSNMESALLQGRSAPRRLQSMTSRETARQQPVPPTRASSVQRYFGGGYPSSRRGPLGMLFRRGEDARLRILRSWIPSCEGLTLLDAGCGDAVFLSRLLHGRPRKVRVVDFVAPQVAIAWNRLKYSADEVETETCELQSSTDTSRYDIVLAMGVFDYTEDWPGLLRSLMRRSEGHVIADFPKAGTLHAGLRRIWLAAHDVSIHATHRDDLDAMLRKANAQAQIVELPLQWIVRIRSSSDHEDMGT
jgi:2-polyprenyl-3-methyl-5-hydroxy-6-metoxy-1,4-benzoquinol methylase